MAVRAFKVPELDSPVYIYKRKGSKQLRLSVTPEGKVRVTIPFWATYRAGVQFAYKKRAWIAKQQEKSGDSTLKEGQRIGKYHTLHLVSDPRAQRLRTRISDTSLFVYYPSNLLPKDPKVQSSAKKLGQKALQQQGEKLIPQRLNDLANKYGYTYASVKVRQLKTRWGSCNSHHELTFNYFLMQMPWELIDYVILHELAHTQQLNHGSAFWALVEKSMPDYKQRRKQLKEYQPSLNTVA